MDYVRLYAAVVQKGAARVIDGYCERHHILPRSMGGSNAPDNIAVLTGREHFLAHWLLFKIHGTPDCARAFRLMLDARKIRRGRDYAAAKAVYALAMTGDANQAKRPGVGAKISAALQVSHPYRGKKRPEHSLKMKAKGHYAGINNPWYGTGDRQIGIKNHGARAVVGRQNLITRHWGTMTDAASDLGVSVQAIYQALRKKQRSKGWFMEYVS